MNALKYLFLLLSIACFTAAGLAWKGDLPEALPYLWYLAIAGLIFLSLTPNSRLIRAAFGCLTLTLTVFFGVQLLSKTNIVGKSFDLTEDNRYTLTEGTRAILSELTEPVVINYYVTRDVTGTPASFKRHIPRVDNFLKEIADLAPNDLITLNLIDPEPDTDEEDAAMLDEVQQIPVTQDDKLIFGASISSFDKKTVIPIFAPEQETQLEYEIIHAIAKVTRRETPSIGIMSAHDIEAGGQGRRPWVFYQMLQQDYDVINLSMQPTTTLSAAYQEREWGEAPDHLDPTKIPLILLVHPAGITPEAEFAIDQYLLRGGTVIACIDPLSAVAQGQRPQQIPGRPPMEGIPVKSSLPIILDKLGLALEEDQIVIDRVYSDNPPNINVVITKEAMPISDDITLSSIENMLFYATGGFDTSSANLNEGKLTLNQLVESSYQYARINTPDLLSGKIDQNAFRFILANQKDADTKVAYVAHLSGQFATAFPEGFPKAETTEDSETGAEEATPAALTNGEAAGNLYLFGDSDFLYDTLSYRSISFLGGGAANTAINGNAPFLSNLIDQAVGSKHLIGARARTPIYRPLTVLQDMNAELEKKHGQKIQDLQTKADNANAELNKIRSQITANNVAQLSSEYQEKREQFNQEVVAANKAIRKEQKFYKTETDKLKAGIFWKSTVLVPSAVLLLGLLVFGFRYTTTHAR